MPVGLGTTDENAKRPQGLDLLIITTFRGQVNSQENKLLKSNWFKGRYDEADFIDDFFA